MKHIQFETIDSTNTYLKKNYQNLTHFTVVSAKHQTQGKGRLGKTWLDDGNSALFSILIKKGNTLTLVPQMPLMAAAAAHKALHSFIPDLKIKWPNDLMVGNLKLAGILVESIITNQTVEALIVGFGINLSTKEFASDLKEIATSVFLQTQLDISTQALIKKIHVALKKELKKAALGSLDYIHYCNTYGSLNQEMISYTTNDETKQAKVIQINDDGSLLIETSTGQEHLSSGLTSLIKIKTD